MLPVLVSRFQMDFTVPEHPGRISCSWKRNLPIPTRISQCLVSDKTFPNPLIYQMANPVNSLRNIITCNLFSIHFLPVLPSPWQPPRSQAGAAASALQRESKIKNHIWPPCLKQQDSAEEGGTTWVQLSRYFLPWIPLDGGNIPEQDLLLGGKKSQISWNCGMVWVGRNIKD